MEKTCKRSKTLLAKCIALACPALVVGAALNTSTACATQTISANDSSVTITQGISETTASAVVVSGTNNTVMFSPGQPDTDVLVGKSGVILSGNNNTFTSNGSITGTGTAVFGNDAGVLLNGSGSTFTNNGVLKGASDVIYARQYATINNNGSIITTGVSGTGIYLNAGGAYTGGAGSEIIGQRVAITMTGTGVADNNLIDNAGTIKSTQNEAIRINDSGKLINREGGVISSVSSNAVTVNGASQLSLENYGTLESGTSTAIRFSGTGNNTLTLGTGSNLIGNVVSATSDTNTLILTGTGTEDASFNGSVPTNGMKSLTMRGSDWTLSGAVNLTGSDENTLVVEQGNLNIAGVTASRGNAQVSSGSSLNVAAGGELHAPQVNIDAGAASLNAGTINGNVINNGTLGAWNTVNAGAASDGIINGSLTNNGTLNLAGSEVGNTITINGNYTGNDGKVVLSGALADDTSKVDHIAIVGDSLGTSGLTVKNVGGMGAQTLQGIELVSVTGASTGTFALDNRVVAGAYEYNLFQNSNDGSWYLSSSEIPVPPPEPTPGPTPDPAPKPSLMRPEVGAYLGNQQAAQQMFISSMYDRYIPTANAQGGTIGGIDSLGWARISADTSESHAAGGQIKMDTDTAMAQFGGDLYSRDGVHAGLMAGIGNSKTDSKAKHNGHSASGSVSGYSAGAYGTWFENEAQQLGTYVDVWGQYNWYSNKVYGDRMSTEKYSSQAFQSSLETGYTLAFGRNETREWAVTPQAQAIYTHYDQNNHTETNGARITGGTDDNVTTRLGVRLANRSFTEPTGLQVYTEANWINGKNADSLNFNETSVSNDVPNNRYEAVLGVAGKLSNTVHVYGQGSGEWGENSYSDYAGQVGVRVSF
ncbi:autotransporter family protein [Dryocola clanedunensis]|uniref:autotransporter family protein n=1 Tax=Cedecea sulfonylureivorans TaxID=3051154 RepID=UPI00192632FF|nr:autotransporter outer membrane beta-barrel domain-containing protein [Cedecea sulfonylureivorans]